MYGIIIRGNKVNIVIAGCGFAGLHALGQLKDLLGKISGLRILVFDKNDYATMIPSLPDLAGMRIEGEFLTEKIRTFIPAGAELKKGKVVSVNLHESQVQTETGAYSYDYLVIATGSVTNFYGFNQHTDRIYKLDSLENALRISLDLKKFLDTNSEPNIAIVGGGYTGIELAFNLKSLSGKLYKNPGIHIIEKGNDILAFLPEGMRNYVKSKLAQNGFQLITGVSISEFDGRDISLTNGQKIRDVFLCWCAGSKFAIPELVGNHKTLGDGRITANPFLQIGEHPNVFVCGDAAAISHEKGYLRKAVNFAIYSGTAAGNNLKNLILKKKLKAFKPLDLGWVIPFGNDSMGRIFNRVNIRGRIGLRLHYFMCGYRNFCLKNTLQYFKKALLLK